MKHDDMFYISAFREWAKSHDGDIDKYELSDIEFYVMCFRAGYELSANELSSTPAPPAICPECGATNKVFVQCDKCYHLYEYEETA